MAGALLHSQAQIIAQLLVDLEHGSTPTSPGNQPTWPVFYDYEPDRPNNCITVTDTQGTLFRNDGFGQRNEHHGIQVKIRGGTHAVGYPKARTIAVAFDTHQPRWVTVGGTRYCVGMIRRTGDVLRMGPEPGSSRRGYTVNALVCLKMDVA